MLEGNIRYVGVSWQMIGVFSSCLRFRSESLYRQMLCSRIDPKCLR